MIDTLLRYRSKAKESTILNDLLLSTEGRIKSVCDFNVAPSSKCR